MFKSRLRTTFLIACLILVLIPIAISATSSEKIITNSDNGKMIYVRTGDIVDIRLSASAGTGYSWNLNLSEGLHLVDTNNYPSHKCGGKLIQEFRIKAVMPGIQHVNKIYKRSWEKDNEKELTFKLDIKVI